MIVLRLDCEAGSKNDDALLAPTQFRRGEHCMACFTEIGESGGICGRIAFCAAAMAQRRSMQDRRGMNGCISVAQKPERAGISRDTCKYIVACIAPREARVRSRASLQTHPISGQRSNFTHGRRREKSRYCGYKFQRSPERLALKILGASACQRHCPKSIWRRN